MAGARPSGFKKPGGYLNNVEGNISDYKFGTEFPGAEKKAPKKSKGEDEFHSLYFWVEVTPDGGAEAQSTTLFVGSADDFEISDDGKTLTPVDENFGLRSNSD